MDRKEQWKQLYWEITRIIGFDGWRNVMDIKTQILHGKQDWSTMADQLEAMLNYLRNGGDQSPEKLREFLNDDLPF